MTADDLPPLPITGWRNALGWCISLRGYDDFGQTDVSAFYSIPLCDLAAAQASQAPLLAEIAELIEVRESLNAARWANHARAELEYVMQSVGRFDDP